MQSHVCIYLWSVCASTKVSMQLGGRACAQMEGKKYTNSRLKVQLREVYEFIELKIHPLKDDCLNSP